MPDPPANAKPLRRRQQNRRAPTRERLLRAAGHVFARRGYYEANLDAIAARAGLTKGAVYYNFESKEDLFVTLLSERLSERLGDLEAALADTEADDDSFEQRAARGFFARLERDPRWLPLFFEFVAFAGRDARAREAFAGRFMRGARAGLAQLIERRLGSAGIVPAMPPAHLAIAVDALANGLALERLMTPDEVPDELFGDVLALLLRGLVTDPRATGSSPPHGPAPRGAASAPRRGRGSRASRDEPPGARPTP